MSPLVWDVISYRETDVKCSTCRSWCRQLLITDDGELRCAPCMRAGRMFNRPSKKKRKGAAA
jgi:hypothetical protein